MEQILKRFTTDNLFNATSALLSKLNIEFDRETAEPISVADLYDTPMPKYLTEALECIKDTYFIGIVNDGSLRGEKAAESLSAVADTMQHGGKYDGMFIFACDAKSDANLTRTAASALTRAFNRIASANPVILIIRQGNLLSLATCERMEYSQAWRQGSGEKLGKVTILRNINCTEPHRGHVDILSSLGSKTFNTFEELYKNWLEVFSSELLTKKFYNELSDWYAWAVMVAKFPNDIRTDEDDAKFNHESCIRLITRLIFVWFLKQKKLIPEEFFDEKYIHEHFIEDFDPHDKQNLLYDAEQSKYYRLILQNLFFAMLNCPIVAEGKTTPNNRRFRGDNQFGFKRDGYNVNNLMRYKSEFAEGGADKFVKLANRSVPFLNGGLFDCLDDKPRGLYYDGFSERKESLEQLFFPDYLFFGDEVGNGIDLSQWYDDKKKKSVSARGIIDILKRYSFTIEENTPYDQEVSLDPELLGKVFENLLAAYNPETKQSARKQTGSFYTPREIVQYMVDESLVAHLKRMCGDEQEDKYRQLLNYASDDVELTEEQRKSIMSAVYNCRVLDPACGSGAFPMGVLQQMVHILKRIDPTNEMWNSMMVDIAIEDARKELKKVASGNEAERAKIEENRKARLDDIENAFNQSINDPDYARKLYLIEHCIYGVDIQPIATQISKLRFFISLVVDQKPTKDAKTNFGIRPLPNLEAKFVTANTLIPLDRKKNLFTDTDEIRYYEEQLHDINHRIFLAKKNTVKKELRELMRSTRIAMAQTMENMGAIGSKGYNQLMEWNMFDQNASASFFDPEWMFGVKDGFDVVIGNPPYAQISKGFYPATTFPYSEGKDKGKQNLYKLFVEFSYNVAKKNGFATMIVQSSLMCDLSSTYTRELLLKHTCLLKMIEFPKTAPTREGQVFESVCQGTCIYLLKKAEPANNVFMLSVNNDCTTIANMKKEMVCQNNLIDFYPNDFAIPLLRSKEFPVLRKIKQNSPLKDYLKGSSQGDLNLTSEKKHFGLTKTGISLIRGRHVGDYFINYDVEENVEFGYKKNVVDFNNNVISIVCQQITGMVDKKRIHCAFTDPQERFLIGNSLNKLVLNDNNDAEFILAVLNSKLMDWVFRKTSSNNHVNCYEIEQLPITAKRSRVLYSLVAEIMRIKKTENKDVINLESQIDHIIYHLYDLTYDEVLIIDPETPITREEYDNFKID